MRAMKVGVVLLLGICATEATAQSKLIVRVRDARGVPLSVQAIVRVYSQTTTVQLTEPTRVGGEAVFNSVPVGNYRVEVSALGYQVADEEVSVQLTTSPNYVFVNLRLEMPKGSAAPEGPPILAPKARKELEKGLEALKANDLKQAQKHLERALKLAPGHPDVNYLMGVLHLQRNEPELARAFLEKAVRTQPEHAPALSALGMLLYEQRDYRGAIIHLENALAFNPQSWEMHGALASACYQEREYEKARAHAERTLELAPGKAPEIRLLLAAALVELGQREKAAQELEWFLQSHAAHPRAAAAQRQLEGLRESPSAATNPSGATDGIELIPPVSTGSAALTAPPPGWAPPDIDAAVPAVESAIACSLPDVLAGTGQRATSLVETLQQFIATEQLEYAEVNEAGKTRSAQAYTVKYMASIHENRPGMFSVEESREGRGQFESWPIRTTGVAALALLFHPYYADDFEMRCEGLGHWQGQPAWQVYFRQRDDRPARIMNFRTYERSLPVKLKGRAWIAANSYHILRLETGLVEPLRPMKLKRDHQIIEYQPVTFAQRDLVFWLPARTEVYLHRGRQRYRHRHSFSNFQLFAADVRIRPYKTPKALPETKPKRRKEKRSQTP